MYDEAVIMRRIHVAEILIDEAQSVAMNVEVTMKRGINVKRSPNQNLYQNGASMSKYHELYLIWVETFIS